ncbi:leptin-B-like isoform X2 [Cyclopterus lumpus]|uniref:leptin-B-like isoform X2 n=1 Tax=Cyclopterus lumpus TaxID=8103 RepID=UPI0014868454|nr:leptin-B-like isoform X2 [Cyclopterus lumpus]
MLRHMRPFCRRMHIFPALLFVSLVVVPRSSSLPTNREVVRNINSMIRIARITLVHINKLRTEWPVVPTIATSPPSIEGLTNISRDLGLLDNELQSPLFKQIQADVSSLKGLVRTVALTMDCPISARPTGRPVDSLFPDSQHHLTLTTVQHYLETVLLHKDKLKVC